MTQSPKSKCCHKCFKYTGADAFHCINLKCECHQPLNEPRSEIELQFCDACIQMTNHIKEVCQKCKSPTEDWAKAFDKKFPEIQVDTIAEMLEATRKLQEYPSRIKSFISSLLTKERQELLAGLEKEVEKLKLLEVGFNPETVMWKKRINHHLSTVISLIKNRK